MDIQFIWDLTSDLVKKEAERADLRLKHKKMEAFLQGDAPDDKEEVIIDDLRKGIVKLNKEINDLQELIALAEEENNA